MGEEKLTFNRRLLVIGNLALLAWIFLASFGVWFFNQLYGWIYLAFLALMVYAVLRRLGCSRCDRCRECTSGFGRLAGVFFGRGYVKAASVGRRVGFVMFLYVVLFGFPVASLLVFMAQAFSYAKLSVLFALLAVFGVSLSTWFNRSSVKKV